MKKFSVALLCCLLVVSGCFVFSGCSSSELDKYDELKEILFELQVQDNSSYIYINGTYHWQNSASHSSTSYIIYLDKLIIAENCLIEFERQYYFYFFEIIDIKDANGNVIWTA